MDDMKFEIIKNKCPWYLSGWGGVCRSNAYKIEESTGSYSHIHHARNLFLCNKKNCAIYYWLKIYENFS